ncbi:MAG TPA: FAD-dependent oxidoreductase [Planctomycetota bacterium]|nr:FAD-dependent oxidoreductase [Planctomycetota bacterium]
MRWMILALLLCAAAPADETYDVVVYGGNSAGIIAAVQAVRMGKTAVLVCPDRHLGGLSSGGLGFTDTGNKSVIGGLSRDFYHRVYEHYQKPEAWTQMKQNEYGNKGQGTPAMDGDRRTMWIFEPHVAEAIFEDYVKEYRIPVHRDRWLDRKGGVQKEGARIVAIRTLDGATWRGRMFIDATYEGDLMAAAGVTYRVGREANAEYGELWNGNQVTVLHHGHHFQKPISPYVEPGKPESGLLYGVSAEPPGTRGEADQRVQAYCYRLCMTDHDENRIPFPKPDGYDPQHYELLARLFEAGWREHFGKFDPIPNHKTDTNNHGPFSMDHIGANYDYPEATYERRREILKDHENYQKGLLYFTANDPRVPEQVRAAMSKWGLPKDEFKDSGGWPHQIYVREARRMAGAYVMTEMDCLDKKETPDSVGMGSYTIDSHNVRRYVKPDGFVQNEGDIGVHCPRPYEIAYGALTPKKAECENLIVPVCLSSTHIAYGSIRMEPVFMILAQSAATAASMAIDSRGAVQDVPYEALKKKLLEDGQILANEKPGPKPAGLITDDARAKLTGDWSMSHAQEPYLGAGYLHDANTDKGKKSARFEVAIAKPGRYDVRVAYTPNPNRATNVPVTIEHADGTSTVKVNQRLAPAFDRMFASVGVYEFTGTRAVVEISNADTDGYVIVDAVQLVEK